MKYKAMLAAKLDDVKDGLTFPTYLSPKLDGIRCMIQDGVAVSRNGKPIPNKYIQEQISKHPILEYCDGELIVGNPACPDTFKNSTSGAMSQEGQPEFIFHIFDRYHPTETFSERLEALQFVDISDIDFVNVLDQTLVYDQATLDELEAINLDLGFEGVMLKRPDGLYKQGRATARTQDLLKVKRFEDAEARIIGYVEGLSNQNELKRDATGAIDRSNAKSGMVPKGNLGAFIVRGVGGQYAGVEFNIGSGFTMEQREEFWKDRNDLLADRGYGNLVKFRFFPSGQDKPRFPVFIGFRHEDDL